MRKPVQVIVGAEPVRVKGLSVRVGEWGLSNRRRLANGGAFIHRAWRVTTKMAHRHRSLMRDTRVWPTSGP